MNKVNQLFQDAQENIIQQLREEIAQHRGWHLDDDHDKIDDILFEQIDGTELEEYLT